MKRTYITPEENRKNCTFKHTAVNLINTHFREHSLVDDFYQEKIETTDGVVVGYQDPIIMLFNQERLSKIGSSAVTAWLDSMKKAQQSNSALAELRKKCSDDDLISLIKSRHLQKPSEIMAWAQYMQENAEEFNENLRNLVAEKQAAEQAVKKTEVTTQTE